MKKIIASVLLVVALFSLSSCEKAVTYLRDAQDGDSEKYDEITDIDAGGDDSVIFYTFEELSDITVNDMLYDSDTDTYMVGRELAGIKQMKRTHALRIQLDSSAEMPYVMVRYTRTNGETREQYLYRDKDEKLWLLERE